MSEQNNAAETAAIFTREDGTTYTVEKFSLAKTKEIADRFRGDRSINIPLPVAVPGNIEATLANLRTFVSTEADFAEVLVAKFNGQGLRLDTQKEVKEFLAPGNEDLKEVTVEEALASAQETADSFRLGAPRKKGTGGSKGKVAAAEAKTAKVANTAIEMYRALPAAMREQYRSALVETGAVTQEELDAVDQELAAEAPATGRKQR
jgi:hypothetical protein